MPSPTAGPGAGLGVVIDSDLPLESVVLYDGDTPLAVGTPGPGGFYSFALDFGSGLPAIAELAVEVTPASGDPVRSETVSVLAADPALFVPLGEDGAPGFGALVPAPGGVLGAFAFYPEGYADADRGTGAHFVFAGGAVPVAGEPAFDAPSVQFFRGATDPAPLPGKAGPRRVRVDAVTPEAVAAEFEVGAGGLTLHWGGGEVGWEEGALSAAGWAALGVAPLLGDFALPAQRLRARVATDPISGELSLLICYHGEWSPAPGEVIFRVPEGDPLKFYLSEGGRVRAHGTVEAEFPSGAVVRGSAAWREPVFEIRLEGRGITVPVAGKLGELMPAGAASLLPAGEGEAELDAAAAALLAYRNTYRGAALSGGKESPTGAAGGAAAPAPSVPSDGAGVGLEAWAWRLRSWDVERPGELLDAAALDALRSAVVAAGEAAEAATAPATALKRLRDVLMVAGNRDRALPGGVLADELAAAEARCFAAAERLLAEVPRLGSDELEEIADLQEQIAEVLSTGAFRARVRRDGTPTPAARLRSLAERASGRVDPDLFRNRGITAGDFDGTDNTDLLLLESAGLLNFLDEVRDVFRLQRSKDASFDLGSPSGFPLGEAVAQVAVPFATRHNIAAEAAVLNSDYAALRAVLRERARYFSILHTLGAAIDSDDERFETDTLTVLQRLLSTLEARLPDIDPTLRAREFFDLADLTSDIALTTPDDVVEGFFASVLAPLAGQNERLRAAIEGSGFCDPVRSELLLRGFELVDLEHGAPGGESNASVPVTGFYESVGGGTPTTLQLGQGGRFITGWLQYHGGGATTARQRLRGVLSAQDDGVLTFAYLRIDEDSDPGADGLIVGSGELVAALEDGVVTLSTYESSPLIAGGVVASSYVQTSRSAPHAEGVRESFAGDMGEVFEALQRAPLHSVQMRALVDQVNGPASAKGLIAEIDRHYAGEVAVANIDSAAGEILDIVSSEQRPLARLLVRQLLSSRFGGPGAGSESHWEKLITARASQPAQAANITALLGLPATVDSAGDELFLYHFRVDHREVALPLEVKNVISSGIHLVEVKVDKYLASQAPIDASTPKLDSSTYTASLGQIGFGVDAASLAEGRKLLNGIPDSGTIVPPDSVASVDEFSCRSNFDYVATDLEGGFYIVSANAGAAFGLGGEVESTAIIFGADGGNKPPLVADPGPTSELVGWRLPSAGLDFSFGALLLKSKIDTAAEAPNAAALLITRDLVRYETEGQAEAGEEVDFRTGSAEVVACGWQNLREFVAEHRALFDSATAEVAIVGSTDTVPVNTPAFPDNLALSQARADAVKSVLVQVLGWPPGGEAAGRLSAEGLGEAPARAAGLGDNVDDAEWRRVTITINDVVQLRVAAPRTQ